MALVSLPRQLVVDASGTPRSGARAYFYQPGSTTPITVYTTAAYSAAHTQPVESTASGLFPAVYVNSTVNATYKLVIKTSTDVEIYSEDNVPALGIEQEDAGNLLYPRTTEETAAGVTPLIYVPSLVLDIERYGAVGDDSTDNTVAIGRALSVAAQKGRAILRIPDSGVFQTDQLALVSNLSIEGHGGVIKQKAAANDFILVNANGALYVDNVHIEGLKFDGNKSNNSSGGGIYGNGRNWTVRNVEMYDCVMAAILFGVSSNGATNTPQAGRHRVEGGLFKNCGKSNGWGALAITHGTDIVFKGFEVWNEDGQGGYGFDVEPELGNTIDGIVVSDFIIRGGQVLLDGANLGGALFAKNLTVANATIDARGSYNPSNQTNMAPLFLRQVRNVGISNVICYGHASATAAGLFVESTGKTTTNSVEKLMVDGLQVESGYTAARAIYLDTCAGVALGALDVEISSSAHAMYVISSTKVRGGRGTIRNAGAGNALNTSGTCTNSFLSRQLYYDGTVSNTGTGIVAERVLTGSKTHDFADLTVSNSENTSVTVTGVELGDHVESVALSQSTGGLVLSGEVTATNTVLVTAFNPAGNGANVNAPSGTLTVRVLKQ